MIPVAMMIAESVNNTFGRTVNPLNRGLTSGGSSGGESALISFGGSILGVGTDIGESMKRHSTNPETCSIGATRMHSIFEKNGSTHREKYRESISTLALLNQVELCISPATISILLTYGGLIWRFMVWLADFHL